MLAYVWANGWRGSQRFAFGTWKIGNPGRFTSAVLLTLVAALMLYQSVDRLFTPSPIHYDEAIVIGVVGL